ncbi:alpha/beta hydrolase [Solwaraspora sp. WMMD406]|uniref:alpha/beta fold hydrolase n=1 Tax=Solwaraspora sp. WMMD406 TaxID=3016095 RepID=UPI002415C00E|nr:alpha/beta hydrolase [Solwaraspora sp. WMMD406]MDG4765032.1 alpha/beta hydrolase [Solwaraspora sp. WMMD406]
MNVALLAVKTGLRATSVVAPGLAGKMAFALFCRLKSPAPVRATDAEMHAQAVVDHMIHDGRRIALYQWGDGANPVLMVHGWESRGSRYATLAKELLARGFSPVTFDAPGNGDSEGNRTTLLEYATIIEELHRRYGPFRAIVSHSFGTLATFQALRAGVKADKVATICGVSEFSYLVDVFSDVLGLTPKVRSDLTVRFAGLFPQEHDIYRRFSATHEAESVTIPVLVVHDTDDAKVSMRQAQTMADAFPNARLVTTSGLGHNRILTDPTTIGVIADFVTETAQ